MKITEAFMKTILAQYSQDEISFSRMVERLNEEVKREMTTLEAGLFERPECPFQYCPHPELCKDKCCNS